MDILSSREIATLIWLCVGLVWVDRKIGLWPLFAGLIRSFFKPILIRAVLYMACYSVLSVWLLIQIGLWELANLKSTILWFLGLALPWMMNVKRFDEDPRDRLSKELKGLLSVTVFVTFLTETYTFPISVELFLVPVAFAITIFHEVSKGDAKLAVARRFFGALLTLLGLGLTIYALLQVVRGWADFATMGTAREFIVTPLLSLLFLPFMYVFDVVTAYSIIFDRFSITLKDRRLRNTARWQAIRAFGLNIPLLRRWGQLLFREGVHTQEELVATISLMKSASAREAKPPAVSIDEGWSPYAAMQWLKDEQLVPKAYNFVMDEWSATSPYREFGKRGFKDNIVFYITGTARAATRLRLVHNVNNPTDKEGFEQAQTAFKAAVVRLVQAAFGDQSSAVCNMLESHPGKLARAGPATALLHIDDAGSGERYRLTFTITHMARLKPSYEEDE